MAGSRRVGRRGGTVSGEIRQSRPFDSPEREAAVTLLRTGDVLRHAVESALRPWGVSPEQYNVLRILRGADRGGLPTLEIAQRMLARSPNMTRLIDKLVAKGLAGRERIESDRRVVRITATAAALSLLTQLDRAIDVMLARLAPLGAGELRDLVGQLDAIRERLAVPTLREDLARRRREDRTPPRDARIAPRRRPIKKQGD